MLNGSTKAVTHRSAIDRFTINTLLTFLNCCKINKNIWFNLNVNQVGVSIVTCDTVMTNRRFVLKPPHTPQPAAHNPQPTTHNCGLSGF